MSIAIVAGVLLVLVFIYYIMSYAKAPDSDGKYVLFNYSIPGDTQQSFPTQLPRSNNQAEGLIKLVIIALNKVVFVEPRELSIFIFFCGSVAPAIHDS